MRVQRSAVIGGGAGSGSARYDFGGRYSRGAAAPPIVIEPPPPGCTINLASADFETVQAQIFAAAPGSVICLPTGTWDWPAAKSQISLIIDRQIVLRGAGPMVAAGQVGSGPSATVIRDLGVENVFRIETVVGAPIRVCNIYFVGGLVDWIAADNKRISGTNCILLAGQGQARVDHCTFDCTFMAPPRPVMVPTQGAVVQVRALLAREGATGVFDHNYCWGGGGLRAAVQTQHNLWQGVGDFGDNSWATPTGWGLTSAAMYYENNTFELVTPTVLGTGNMFAHDSHQGARGVFRFNLMINSNIALHGSEAGARGRGSRMAEVYGNIAPDRTADSRIFCDVRSGTIVCHSNTVGKEFTSIVRLDNNRSTQNYGTWLSSDGSFPLDLNDTTGGPLNNGVYESGIVQTGSGNGFLVDPSKNFSTTDWVAGGYSLRNTSTNEGSFIIAQTGTTITTQPGVSNSGPVFTPGDSYQIMRCQRPMDCCGLGQGALLMNVDPVRADTGLKSWVQQINDPVYTWNNTLDGVPNNNISSPVPHIKAGRDYFIGIQKPPAEYTPFAGRHPLCLTGFTAGD